VIAHGTERSRKIITDRSEPVELENTITSERFSMSMCSHTYTQTEKFCRKCGWVTCKGILGALICPGECGETWL
jgi:hypothetical protein